MGFELEPNDHNQLGVLRGVGSGDGRACKFAI